MSKGDVKVDGRGAAPRNQGREEKLRREIGDLKGQLAEKATLEKERDQALLESG